MVFSITDTTEEAIKRMTAASKAKLNPHNNPVINKRIMLGVATLEKAPRDPGALMALIKEKQLENERTNDIVRTQRLVLELEMLKVILYLVTRTKCLEY